MDIFIGILGPYPGGWRCRLADHDDGEYGSRCTGAEGLTPAEAIAAVTEELREWIDYWENAGHQLPAPLTAQTVAASGLADDDETLVLIPIARSKRNPQSRGTRSLPKNKTIEERLATVRAAMEEGRARYGYPPPLTEEELDCFETEIHNWLRRGRRQKEGDDNE